MIISHKYKFIFLKTKKTAGTSIEIALSKFCEGDDLITLIHPKGGNVRQKLGYDGSQNCVIPWSRYTWKDWLHFGIRRERLRFFNHMPAGRIRRGIGSEIWNSYYKFCFERNPWDRAVSWYFWNTRNEAIRPTLSEFLKGQAKHNLSNWYIYSINSKIAVDHIGLYENLGQELESILKRLGLPHILELPRVKGHFRNDRRHYRELMGEAERELIARVCSREISRFGYEF